MKYLFRRQVGEDEDLVVKLFNGNLWLKKTGSQVEILCCVRGDKEGDSFFKMGGDALGTAGYTQVGNLEGKSFEVEIKKIVSEQGEHLAGRRAGGGPCVGGQ